MQIEQRYRPTVIEKQKPVLPAPEKHDLQLHLNELDGGRKSLEFTIGSMAVQALEIPAQSLSDEEWFLIQTARGSYASMWGGNGIQEMIKEDPFDGRSPDQPYETYHYIAKVAAPGEVTKIITMRKVFLKPEQMDREPELNDHPIDISFWNVEDNQTGEVVPLWEELKDFLGDREDRNGEKNSNPENKIAAISKTGTYPFEVGVKDQRQREKTGIAFAAIQVLATEEDKNTALICQLCPEFKERVLSVKNEAGEVVMPGFTRTDEIIDFGPNKSVVLDNDNDEVLLYKTNFPGYWVNNDGASKLLMNMIQEGKLSLKDLLPICRDIFMKGTNELGKERVINDLSKAGIIDPDSLELTLLKQEEDAEAENARLTNILSSLTHPRYFKFFTHFLKTEGNINKNLTGEELRDLIIHEAGDGPFSSLLLPEAWRESALRILSTAHEKYQKSDTIEMPIFPGQ